jgi:hypothetical protein
MHVACLVFSLYDGSMFYVSNNCHWNMKYIYSLGFNNAHRDDICPHTPYTIIHDPVQRTSAVESASEGGNWPRSIMHVVVCLLLYYIASLKISDWTKATTTKGHGFSKKNDKRTLLIHARRHACKISELFKYKWIKSILFPQLLPLSNFSPNYKTVYTSAIQFWP